MSVQKRPLSPHLSVYKVQITSSSSILGRIFGIVSAISFFVFLMFFVYSTYSITSNYSIYKLTAFTIFSPNDIIQNLSRVVFVGIVHSSLFYILSLVRHLFWDMGYLLDMKSAKIAGWLMFVLTFIGTITVALTLF